MSQFQFIYYEVGGSVDRLINIDQIRHVERSGDNRVMVSFDKEAMFLDVSIDEFFKALYTDTNGPILLKAGDTPVCYDCEFCGGVAGAYSCCSLFRSEFPNKHCEKYTKRREARAAVARNRNV